MVTPPAILIISILAVIIPLVILVSQSLLPILLPLLLLSVSVCISRRWNGGIAIIVTVVISSGRIGGVVGIGGRGRVIIGLMATVSGRWTWSTPGILAIDR